MRITGEVLTVNRARFAQIDMERMASLRGRALAILQGDTGLLSLTLWEHHDDPFRFMIFAHFATHDDSLQAWDKMVNSPVMEVLTDLMVDPPNVQSFDLQSRMGKSLEDTSIGTFCSMSARVADLGFGPSMREEMDTIFEELKPIPGFLGGLNGQLREVSDEILGIMLWDSKKAYEASLPKTVTFKIDLYQRVL